MDPLVIDLIKFCASVGGGFAGGLIKNRKLSKKVSVLESENSQQKQNVDSMQTTLLTQQSKLIEYQDKLITTAAELKELQGKFHVLELKSNADEAAKRVLQARISELEAICSRQEQEITELKFELEAAKSKIAILES
jgi:uncharacterized coiled-coil protein SlyX